MASTDDTLLTSRARRLLLTPTILVALSAACSAPHTMTPQPSSGACSMEARPGEGRISWYGPAQSRDRRILADWCATLGPPVIDSLPAARFPAWQAGQPLAVITWNTHVGGGHLVELLEGELGFSCDQQTRATAESFSHFVLLLQEVYRRSERVPDLPAQSAIPRRIMPDERPEAGLDIVGVARECGLALVYIPSMRNGHQSYDGGREDRGNAILSTLALSDFIAIEIPFEASRKVAVGATVRTARGDSLRLISVHLDVSASLFRIFTTGNATRVRQSRGFVEALAMAEEARGGVSAGYPIATVAAGDFNTWSVDDTAIRETRKSFPDSPASNGVPTRGGFPTDFIFFREANDGGGGEGGGGGGGVALIEDSFRRIEDAYDSDHRALIAWFETAN